MTTKHLYPAGFLLFIIGMTACNGNGSNSGTPNPGDSSVTTTTTTSTIHHKYTGSFVPQPDKKYVDLKTNKEVKVRIDTVQGSIVNDETNEPLDLFVEPVTHDTIYALTGAVVNNYIIHDSTGAVRVDTVRINTIVTNTVTADDGSINGGEGKYKEKNDKSKYKDADEKVKEKNGVIKTKGR